MGAKSPHNMLSTDKVGGNMGVVKREYRRTPHTVYELKYHFIWIPKYRYGVLEGTLRERLKGLINQICDDMGILVVEGQICKDHIHVCLSVPPRHSPAEVMKQIKGKTSEILFREFPELKKRYWGQHLWGRGYFVSSVGIDEATIKKYIQSQREDIVDNQLKFWK